MASPGPILRRLVDSPTWRRLGRLALGLALMRLFFAFYPVFLSGPEIAPPFPENWEGAADAEFAPEDGTLAVRLATLPAAGSRLEFPVASVRGMDALRVRAQIRAADLIRGQHAYSQGRVLLGFVDRTGKSRWDWPHTAGTAEDTTSWRTISHRFLVPEEAESARLLLLNHGRSGLFYVRSVSVVPLRLNPWTPVVFVAWGLAWALAVLASARRLHLGSRRGGRAVLLAGAAIVTGMLLSERALSAVSVNARRLVARLERPAVQPSAPAATPAPKPAIPARPIRDFLADSERTLDLHRPGHFLVFAWLAFAAAGCFGFRRADGTFRLDGLAALALFSAAAEQLQWLTLSRNARFADITVNLLGLAAGLLLARAAHRGSVPV
jgi:hypothetical protein